MQEPKLGEDSPKRYQRPLEMESSSPGALHTQQRDRQLPFFPTFRKRGG